MTSRAKMITVAQQKGGAGKTTIAAHIAIALMQKGNKVALIDIDPQASLTKWHEIRNKNFGDGFTGVTFRATSGWRINSEIMNLKNDFDYIIVDSPPHMEIDAKSAIRASDLLLIPIQPSPTDLWATKATLDLAKSEGIKHMLIMNRVTPNSKLAIDIAKQLDNPLKATLGNRVAFASCMMDGKCVTEVSPNNVASQEIKKLVGEVEAIFKKEKKAQSKAA